MSAPLAKGIIIAAGVLVAAGIALYQDEQFRVWVDERRRRIAMAFYDNMGENMGHGHEMRETGSSEDAYLRRFDIVQRNRAELIRRAREEGIAVDLDELAALSALEEKSAYQHHTRQGSNTSFDDFLTPDGKLKDHSSSTEASSSAYHTAQSSGTIRQRGAGARGFESGSSWANPFSDEHHVLFDHNAPSTEKAPSSVISIPITDAMDSRESQYKSDEELADEIREAIRLSLEDAGPVHSETQAELAGLDESLYGSSPLLEPTTQPMASNFLSHSYHPPPLLALPSQEEGTITPRHVESGLVTPISSDSHTLLDMEDAMAASIKSNTLTPEPVTRETTIRAETPELITGPVTGGHQEDETETETESITDFHSLPSDDEIFDVRSVADSEFSMVSGTLTPTSWTDVDTDAEGDENHATQQLARS